MVQKITPDNRLVVAKMLPDGRIDQSSIQPLEQWQRGPRDFELMRHGYGHQLLSILTEDLGLVTVNEDGLLHSRIIIVRSEEDVRSYVMRILGKIAEAQIVRSCQADIYANRRWGQIARKGRSLHYSLDRYLAIGTGFQSTKIGYFQKYNPNDSQRDVIWIDTGDMRRELQMLSNGKLAGYSAGLQVKVSMDGYRYIFRTDIQRAKYEVPLVYFDLCNDYYKLTDTIYRQERDLEVGVDIVRGKDVDPALHDTLCSYWWLVEQLVRGAISVDQLVKDELLTDAFKKELLESAGSQIITL